ncbi:MAG: protein phosphatase 2C domain-containing protein, partial [Chloroflexota bacterium]
LVVGYQTHPGETGKNNEDRAVLLSYRGGPGEPGGVTVAVVADGIGGNQAGEVASQLAVDTITGILDQADSRSYLDLFARGFANTSQALANHVTQNPQAEGMGTTCAAVVVANRRLYTAYIGDSRIYLIRNGTIRQTTVDHTWVQEAIEAGVLTKEQARKHPNRHVVRRHLGAKQESTPDYRLQLSDGETPEAAVRNQGLPLKPGDIILISSDGMTDLVEDPEILAAFQNQTPQQAVDALTALARQRGGFDNITMVALQVPGASAPRASGTRLAGTALVLALLGGVVVLAAVAALIVGSYFYFFTPLRASTATPTVTLASTSIPTQPILLTLTSLPITFIPYTPTALPPTATLTPRPIPTGTLAPSPTLDPSLAPPLPGGPPPAGSPPATP